MRGVAWRPILLVAFSLFCLIAYCTPADAQGWSNGYSYRRAITISHTKVPTTDQTDFPVLVSGTFSYLATTANGGNVTNSSAVSYTHLDVYKRQR